MGGVHPRSVHLGSTWVPRYNEKARGPVKIVALVDHRAGTHFVVESMPAGNRRRLISYEGLIRRYQPSRLPSDQPHGAVRPGLGEE